VVGVVVPMVKNTELIGEEKVINLQDTIDSGLISVCLKNLKNMVLAFTSILFCQLFERILMHSRSYDISWDTKLSSFSSMIIHEDPEEST
jgi:hypothetical protein